MHTNIGNTITRMLASEIGTQLHLGLRNGVAIYCELLRRICDGAFTVQPWGTRRPLSLTADQVTSARAPAVETTAQYHAICTSQRRTLEGEGAADA